MDQEIYPAWIYGIFDDFTDECYYVGATQHQSSAIARHLKHVGNDREKFRDVKNKCVFRILEELSDRRLAHCAEKTWIEAFKKLGQARYNRNLSGYIRTFRSPPYVRLTPAQKEFIRQEEAYNMPGLACY